MARVFYALWPDDDTRTRIEQVRRVLSPASGRPVRTANLHVTLAFLGSIPPLQVEQLLGLDFSSQRFTLLLESLGWWQGPGVIWLAPARIPAEMTSLVKQINALTTEMGIPRENRAYRPHLTLFREARCKPPIIEFSPVVWNIDQFSLVESSTLQEGPQYQIIKTWPLSST